MIRPYFIWEYNLTEGDVRRILKSGDEARRRWLVARILSHAHFKDVFKYLTIQEILEIFPKLKMSKDVSNAWERALKAWGYNAAT